jgi:hypothetical protein
MANETMTLIGTVNVPSGGYPAVEFDNIPQTFTDLALYFSGRSTTGGVDDWTNCQINGISTGATLRSLYGTGSSTTSISGAYFEFGREAGAGATANTFGSCFTYFPNYTSSAYKSWSYDSVGENNGSSAYQFIAAGLWSNTAAITKLTLATNAAWTQYSTFSLYGIKKGSGGATVS